MSRAPTPQGRATRWPERQAERSDGPSVPGLSPCGRAEEHSGLGGAEHHALRELTHCTLFELNERSEWCELCNAPRPRAPQVARSAAEGRGNRGSPSFAYFSWAIARKVSRRRGRNPASFRHSPPWRKEALSLTRGIAVLAERCVAPAESSTALAERCRDMRPAAQSLSLASPRESNQREGDPGPHVPPLRSGQPAVLGPWVNCTTRTTHFVRSAQTKCNESVHEARDAPRHPWPCAPRRAYRGGSGNGDVRAIASLGLGIGPSLCSADAAAAAAAASIAVAASAAVPDPDAHAVAVAFADPNANAVANAVASAARRTS
jgi:hypothetical protein